MLVLGERKDDVGRDVLVVEEHDEGGGGAGAVGAAMHAGGERLGQPARLGLGGEHLALVFPPGQRLRVEPDQHGRVAADDALRIGDADLVVALGVDGEVEADRTRDLLQQRSSRQDEVGCLQLLPLALLLDDHLGEAVAAGLGGDEPAAQEFDALLPRRLQHHHAELLGAEPAGAARVRDDLGRGRKIGEVAADQRLVGDDVGAREREIETVER